MQAGILTTGSTAKPPIPRTILGSGGLDGYTNFFSLARTSARLSRGTRMLSGPCEIKKL